MKNLRFIIISICLCVTVMWGVQPMTLKAQPYLNLVGSSGILIEETTGKILYALNENERVYPASLTKILTAMVTLDYLDPAAIIVCGTEVNGVPIDSSKAGHRTGESLLVENMIRGLIIPSGNETACVAAKAVALLVKDVDDIAYQDAEVIFCDLMNKKARELGAIGTHFVNPHGYHDDQHYTTAYDMALIAREAMEHYPLIRQTVKEISFTGNGAGENPDPSLRTQEYTWTTHNWLLSSAEHSYPYATGIKTGFTNEAGYCLAASAEKDGKKLIAIVMNSTESERYDDVKTMFNYGFDNFEYRTLAEQGEILDEVLLARPQLGEPETLELLITEGYTGFFNQEEFNKITREIIYEQNKISDNKEEDASTQYFSSPISKGEEIGMVSYMLDGEELFSTPLVASRDVAERSLKTDIAYYFDLIKKNVLTLKALPFWLGGIAIIIILILIFRRLKRRRRRNTYKLYKRY